MSQYIVWICKSRFCGSFTVSLHLTSDILIDGLQQFPGQVIVNNGGNGYDGDSGRECREYIYDDKKEISDASMNTRDCMVVLSIELLLCLTKPVLHLTMNITAYLETTREAKNTVKSWQAPF